MAPWGIARRLFAIDVLTMAFVTSLGAGTLALSARVPAWQEVAAVCAIMAACLPLVAWLRTHLDLAPVRFVHDWAFALLLYFIYREVVLVAGSAPFGYLYDPALISADRWIFGTDPTVWLQRIAFPALTELLQLAYATFYALFLAVAFELYARGADARFRQWLFICGVGFFLSYVGYLTMPAVGPRFTIHGLSRTEVELPGLWLTPFLRYVIDVGGMVPLGVPDRDAIGLAARDAFPSGHALMTLVPMWWAWRERLRVRWPVTVAGGLLLVATVYLRYHYVVDVLAGAVLAAVVIATGPVLHRWLSEQLGTWDTHLSSGLRGRR